jgi:hypothetical protein
MRKKAKQGGTRHLMAHPAVVAVASDPRMRRTARARRRAGPVPGDPLRKIRSRELACCVASGYGPPARVAVRRAGLGPVVRESRHSLCACAGVGLGEHPRASAPPRCLRERQRAAARGPRVTRGRRPDRRRGPRDRKDASKNYYALQGWLEGYVVHGMQGFDYERAARPRDLGARGPRAPEAPRPFPESPPN